MKASSQGATDATTAGSTSDATTEATSSASTSSASTDDPIEDPCGPPGPTPADLDALCGLAEVFFAADSDVLDGYTRCRLSFTAPCFAEHGEWILEAHASDAEGTGEQTILLADRRGQAVFDFLAAHGVPPGQMQVISKGKLEATIPSVETDQRVIFFDNSKF
ncbi:MAG: hypothetical protein KC636_12890 [Myxococcales bacterium]|nr:hypothetical protein [Myxococcales bacterium]